MFSRSGGHKTKETYPTRPGSPTPCKQALIGTVALNITNSSSDSTKDTCMIIKLCCRVLIKMENGNVVFLFGSNY